MFHSVITLVLVTLPVLFPTAASQGDTREVHRLPQLKGQGPATDTSVELLRDGDITEIISSTGAGPGEPLFDPYDVAVDSQRNVYVPGHNSDNVFKITPDGDISELIDATGDGAGNPLDRPYGIAVDQGGNVYVAGAISDNVFRIAPDGVITEIIDSSGDGTGNTLDFPVYVATDASGSVYVTAGSSNNAFRIAPDGAITEIIDSSGDGIGNGLSLPWGIAVDSTDNVLVAGRNSDNVFQISPTGTTTEIIDADGDGAGNPLEEPFQIAVDNAGNTYVTGNSSHNAFRIAPEGTIAEIIDFSGDGNGNVLAHPDDVVVDPIGRVYVSGVGSDNVFEITPDGVITEIVDEDGGGFGLRSARGVAVGSNCDIYVVGSGSNNALQIVRGCTPCEQTAADCHTFVTDDASFSGSNSATAADDFTPAAEGTITQVCWWGAYPIGYSSDDFTITYYASDGGVPGSVIGGPFSQSGGTLLVGGPFDTGASIGGMFPIYEHTARHTPVAVSGGTCLWIEIKNDPADTFGWFWVWSQDGNQRRIVDIGSDGYDSGDLYANESDFAFCVNVGLGLPLPAGDLDCDADVDLGDLASFQPCFGGANQPFPPTCQSGTATDFDNDGDVDIEEFNEVLINLGGPGEATRGG